MSDKIKTRDIVKDIKVIDKAGNAADRMKNAFVHTKDEAQNTQQSEHSSPTEYASDNATHSAENTVYETGHQVKKQTGKIFDKVKDARNAKKKAENVSGPIKEQAKKYTQENMRKSTQATKPKWDTCPKGITKGFSGLYLTAEQLSRCGQLILDKGVWNDKQLIPSCYIEQATSVQIETSNFNPYFATDDHHQGYGFQIWMNSYPNSYWMDGLYGQYVVMLPDKNAVITYISKELGKSRVVRKISWY